VTDDLLHALGRQPDALARGVAGLSAPWSAAGFLRAFGKNEENGLFSGISAIFSERS
jgi:hypothetical protein